METTTDNIERAHRTLGLRVFATRNEIKIAWRVRARETHPDHGGSNAAFREVQTAAEFLLKEGVREFYQVQFCAQPVNHATPPETANEETEETHEAKVPRPTKRRLWWLLACAMFGCILAPHYEQLGLTEFLVRDFCEVMHTADWIFFVAWVGIKRLRAATK